MYDQIMWRGLKTHKGINSSYLTTDEMVFKFLLTLASWWKFMKYMVYWLMGIFAIYVKLVVWTKSILSVFNLRNIPEIFHHIKNIQSLKTNIPKSLQKYHKTIPIITN